MSKPHSAKSNPHDPANPKEENQMENELEQDLEQVRDMLKPKHSDMTAAALYDKAFNAGIEAALGALPEKQYSVATHNKARYESDFDIGYNAYADQAKAAIEGLKK